MLFPLKFWPDFPILFPGFLGSQCIFWVELSLLLVCFRLWYIKKGYVITCVSKNSMFESV